MRTPHPELRLVLPIIPNSNYRIKGDLCGARHNLPKVTPGPRIDQKKISKPKTNPEPWEDPKQYTPKFWTLRFLWCNLQRPKVDLLLSGYLYLYHYLFYGSYILNYVLITRTLRWIHFWILPGLSDPRTSLQSDLNVTKYF